MCKLDELKAKRDEIYQIARAHNVEKLYVFGSTARQEETYNSDIDFIVDYLRGATYFDHSAFKEEISALLRRKVDVVSMRTLNDDDFSQSVRKEMVAL